MGAKAYFIRGGTYARYDVQLDGVEPGYPKPLAGGYTKIGGTGFEAGVDTAIDLGHGKLYLFRGDSYLRIDNETNTVEVKAAIAGAWPGLAERGFGEQLDAAFCWNAVQAFFFKGGQFLEYDIANDTAVGDVGSIADSFHGLAEVGFADGLDAVVNWGNDCAYFFKGDQYVRYSLGNDARDGDPTPVAGVWHGLEAFGSVVDAAWVKQDTAPTAPLQPGDHVWWWAGQMSAARDIPRWLWFPTSKNDTDYENHGKEIYQYVVHDDGTVLAGQPQMRGFPGSQAWLNRNPGNITGASGGTDYGQYPGKFNWHSFLIFPNRDAGFAAIGTLLRSDKYRDLTLLAAFERYAPAKDGNKPDQYASDVAGAAGVSTSTTISALDADQLLLVQQKIEQIEGTIVGWTYDRDGNQLAGPADGPGLPEDLRALF
jgi:hypothetical protein